MGVARVATLPGTTLRVLVWCQEVITLILVQVTLATLTALHHAHTMCLLLPSTQLALQASIHLQDARGLAQRVATARVSRLTRHVQPLRTVSVESRKSCKSSQRMAPCMSRSRCTEISQLTSRVYTSTPQEAIWVAMPSPLWVTENWVARSTGRSRTAGMRIGATVATS